MNLDRALAMAVTAHAGQRDKAGAPYILHPLRLMMKMATEPARIVAVLHDVIEDSAVTFEDLWLAGFSDEVVAAVHALTRREGEDYEAYVRRAAGHPLARVVKVADLEDNMDLRRLQPRLAAADPERMLRYRRAYEVLTGHAECGVRNAERGRLGAG